MVTPTHLSLFGAVMKPDCLPITPTKSANLTKDSWNMKSESKVLRTFSTLFHGMKSRPLSWCGSERGITVARGTRGWQEGPAERIHHLLLLMIINYWKRHTPIHCLSVNPFYFSRLTLVFPSLNPSVVQLLSLYFLHYIDLLSDRPSLLYSHFLFGSTVLSFLFFYGCYFPSLSCVVLPMIHLRML